MSCNCVGSCNCASVTIPIGLTGPAGPTGLTGSQGIQGIAGPTGPAGATGSTPTKYAVTVTVPTGTSTSAPYNQQILIGAITSCNALINTCASTPSNLDFTFKVWAQFGSTTTWVDLGYYSLTSTIISGVTFDTSANLLNIAFIQTGTFRIVVFG